MKKNGSYKGTILCRRSRNVIFTGSNKVWSRYRDRSLVTVGIIMLQIPTYQSHVMMRGIKAESLDNKL